MAVGNAGCFAWCVCIKRWARFRNRFRRRFYATIGQTVDQSTILNETGTPDTVVSKVPYKVNKVVPSVMTPGTTFTIEDYVSAVISRAADILISERKQQTFHKNGIISADDNISLTSSIISQIADCAVTESLTKHCVRL